MKNEKWDDVHGNTTPDDRMVAFLESPTDSYTAGRRFDSFRGHHLFIKQRVFNTL